MQQHAETSRNIETVNTYLDGFRKNDHKQILACLTDDIEWVLHGHKTLQGKDAFGGELHNDAFEGRPAVDVGGGAASR